MMQFTLLIPTYGRPALLRRLLHYYENKSFQYPIIIADSSDTTAFGENRETISHCRACKVEHHSFDPSIEFFEKVVRALKTVDTPYVSLCADDDFIASRSITRSVEFLTKHPSYSAAQGRSFTVEISDDRRLRVVAYPQHAIKGVDAKTRLESYFENPSANFYAIYRTAVLKEIMEHISRNRTDNTRFEELAVSSLGAISGNIAVLPTLHMVRQSSRKRADSGSRQTGSWVAVMESPAFTTNKERFLELITEALVEGGIERPAARQCIQTCFDIYLGQAQGNMPRPQRITLLDRLVALSLSPIATTKPRTLAVHLLRHIPFVRTLRSEFLPIAQLISQHPNGIETAP